MSKKKRVLIVDDHPLVRKGISSLIAESPDFEVCGGADSRGAALDLADNAKPDMAIVDLSLGANDGLDLIKDWKVRFPEMAILVVSMHDELLFAERALRAGARGYLMKAQSGDLVLAALRKVANGEIYLSEGMANRLLRQSLQPGADAGGDVTSCLSDREMQVFQRLGDGQGPGKIAKELNLSVKTVEYYRDRLKDKLQIGSSAELVQFAVRWKQQVEKA